MLKKSNVFNFFKLVQICIWHHVKIWEIFYKMLTFQHLYHSKFKAAPYRLNTIQYAITPYKLLSFVSKKGYPVNKLIWDKKNPLYKSETRSCCALLSCYKDHMTKPRPLSCDSFILKSCYNVLYRVIFKNTLLIIAHVFGHQFISCSLYIPLRQNICKTKIELTPSNPLIIITQDFLPCNDINEQLLYENFRSLN